jgi:hypothetical protein
MTRHTIALLMTLALGFLVAPLAAAAPPQGKIPRIGFLTDRAAPPGVEAFQRALCELGYVEGHTILQRPRGSVPRDWGCLTVPTTILPRRRLSRWRPSIACRRSTTGGSL